MREQRHHFKSRVVPLEHVGQSQVLCGWRIWSRGLTPFSEFPFCSVYVFSKPAAPKCFLSATPSSPVLSLSLKQSISYSPTGFPQALPPWGASGWKEGPGTAGGSPGPPRPDHWTLSWFSHTFRLGPDQSLQEFLLFLIELQSVSVEKMNLLSIFIIERKQYNCLWNCYVDSSLSVITISTTFLSTKY